MGLAVAIGKGARDVAWFVRGVLGEDAYEKYVAHYESHRAATGTDDSERGELMTPREFWRDHADRQDRNPQGRCC